jgi:hypothetical protein
VAPLAGARLPSLVGASHPLAGARLLLRGKRAWGLSARFPTPHVKFVAVSLATVKKFCTIAEREMRGHATAISVSVAVPSSSR